MRMNEIGRSLTADQQPIHGSGFKYASNSRLADLLMQRISPIYSRPTAGEWFFQIPAMDETPEFERYVGISRSGNQGPPEHIHIGYDEYGEVVEGEFILTLNGEESTVVAGDSLVIPKGVPHTIRAGGSDGFAAAIVETRPSIKFGQLIPTLYGLDHDGKLNDKGEPGFWQAMAFGSYYAEDTVFMSPPPAIAVPLAKVLTPIARLQGYSGYYERYGDASFWESRVEQPRLQMEAVVG